MALFDRLIRLARAVLRSVTTQLFQQFDVVEDQALTPLRGMVRDVTGGIWRGAGADAFVEEVSSLMIPGIGVVGENITSINRNIQRAIDVMDRADTEVSTKVKNLDDVFSRIYF